MRSFDSKIELEIKVRTVQKSMVSTTFGSQFGGKWIKSEEDVIAETKAYFQEDPKACL